MEYSELENDWLELETDQHMHKQRQVQWEYSHTMNDA